MFSPLAPASCRNLQLHRPLSMESGNRCRSISFLFCKRRGLRTMRAVPSGPFVLAVAIAFGALGQFRFLYSWVALVDSSFSNSCQAAGFDVEIIGTCDPKPSSSKFIANVFGSKCCHWGLIEDATWLITRALLLLQLLLLLLIAFLTMVFLSWTFEQIFLILISCSQRRHMRWGSVVKFIQSV